MQVPRPSQVAVRVLAVPRAARRLCTPCRARTSSSRRSRRTSPSARSSLAPRPCRRLRGSGLSASIGQQVPSRPVRLQETQAPWQATLQQTPSAQKLEAHWSLVSQAGAFHALAAAARSTHCCPLTHWLLVVQVSKQSPVAGLHENGTQMRVGPGLQCPPPSQAYDPTTASPSHMPGLHIVVHRVLAAAAAARRTCRRARRSRPASSRRCSPRAGSRPDDRFTHCAERGRPVADSCTLRCRRCLQQTPSTQNPLAHSGAALAGLADRLRPRDAGGRCRPRRARSTGARRSIPAVRSCRRRTRRPFRNPSSCSRSRRARRRRNANAASPDPLAPIRTNFMKFSSSETPFLEE